MFHFWPQNDIHRIWSRSFKCYMNENNLTNSEYLQGVNISGAFALISITHPISAVPVTLKYSWVTTFFILREMRYV